MCQQDDDVKPYIEAVKRLYKDLLTVKKNKSTGKVEVASVVYAVENVRAMGSADVLPINVKPCDSWLKRPQVKMDPKLARRVEEERKKMKQAGNKENDDSGDMETINADMKDLKLAKEKEREAEMKKTGEYVAKGKEGQQVSLFPSNSPHNMCFVSVDASKRTAVFYYYAHTPAM